MSKVIYGSFKLIIKDPDIQHKCFWCGDDLPNENQRTRDHLFYRRLRNTVPANYRHASVTACIACNNARSRISSLHALLLTGKWKTNHSKTVRQVLPILDVFRQKINDLLLGDVRESCLQEINEIITLADLPGKESA